ncbi:MAG: LysR family transcriptional regulator, partial [Bacilli bacterium]|nr:LysR family transcriptional regulator [Bacilli bacterium]
MFNSVNLNTLKYFYEIASTKNITKASENLNVSQPALTKAIKQLESDLNTKLFIRSKKGVVLTDTGEILYDYTKTALADLSSTLNVINQDREKGGHFYIGATTTNFLEPILPTLDKFRDIYPNIKIEIVLE